MNNHIKQSPMLSLLSLGGGSHSTLVRAAGGGELDLTNVQDFTGGSAPTGWTDAQMNNTSSTFDSSTLTLQTDIFSPWTLGDMYFQRGDATNRSSYNLRYNSGLTGDHLFQLSIFGGLSSVLSSDWGIGLCDALPTERTQNFWNGVGSETHPWWWKNGPDNGGQVGKRNRRFAQEANVSTLYNENFSASCNNNVDNVAGWKTMHFQYMPSVSSNSANASSAIYKGKVTTGKEDWAQTGTQIGDVAIPAAFAKLNTTYYVGIGADNDGTGLYGFASAFRFTNDSSEFF
jgi:hypothetical protein